ncbi:MAG: Bax inhibitor-1/YccA family protein [Planctomycetaceae bacterium]|nr:Bax inhibitor-1/YccA family protein [Planctomycetaceae bacterium]
MRSSNPALSENVLDRLRHTGFEDSTVMTVTGTAVKTLIAITLLLLTAGMTWITFQQAGGIGGGGLQAIQPYWVGGLIVGLIAAVATMFKPNWAPWTTPVYALAEGCLLGGISAIIQAQIPQVPIVFQACLLTVGTLVTMLFLYQTGIIKVTQGLRMGIVAATGAVGLVYVASILLSFFGIQIPFIHSAGPIGIGFSVVVVGIAAFNLLLDFDMIDRMSAQRAPKQMEWYAAFALLMTLVWLYIEILRLLRKLNERD